MFWFSARAALLAIVVSSCGCSLIATKTPTPAARIDSRELAQLPPPPGERFYLILFASQDWTRRPTYTHTWATLVRAIDSPDGCEPRLEVNTISWLPTKLDITPSRRVESGINVELHQTIANSLRTKQDIAMWGPYEVWHGFAHRFLVQKAFLESGAIGYQQIDTIGEAGRYGTGCDCIHAVSDMDPSYPRWRYPLALYGQPATANLVRRIMHAPVTIEAPTTHDWLIPRLGLEQYCIERRKYKGHVEPYDPVNGGGLNYARRVPLPAAPAVPKNPTPKTAPGTGTLPKKITPKPKP
jgi:hypothetical protein